jgi:hypothetical protein
MSCGYLTRILNLGDTEMYCTLVHKKPWGGGGVLSRMTPSPSMLMLHILRWRHQNLKYNKHLYFKHVVPLILAIHNPVLITGLHFRLLSQVPQYYSKRFHSQYSSHSQNFLTETAAFLSVLSTCDR